MSLLFIGSFLSVFDTFHRRLSGGATRRVMATKKRKAEAKPSPSPSPALSPRRTRSYSSSAAAAGAAAAPPAKKPKSTGGKPKGKAKAPGSPAPASAAAGTGGDTAKTVIVEACKQCQQFTKRAMMVKDGLESGVPGITVIVNPEKPRRGCFEIREADGETFVSLLNMIRPYKPMRELDMDALISDIIKKVK
uniref:Selenoprotein H n=1 Tax=Anthurium amnicola TaxID=1678845 RepID=A0A1D1YJP8_9ARAE